MINKKQLDLESIIEQINIRPGDKVLVSSSLIKILIALKKKNKKFNSNLIIDALKKKVGPKGTLLFPSYNWDFCKGKDFYYNKTLSRVGSLSNFALKRKDFKRTKNPIYSFAVTGKDMDYICNLDHKNCFGLNSPFGYLIKNRGKNLFIGIDYKHGFTFAHVAEETVGVDYRYYKHFSGFYIDKYKAKKRVKYKMYVRDLSLNVITGIDNKLDKILYKNKAYEKKVFNGISFILIDINQAYQAMLNDLKSKGGIIYPQKIKGLEDLATPIR